MDTRKRKVSVRRIIQTLVTFLVTGACCFALISADKSQQKRVITGLFIHVENGGQSSFIDKNEVRNMLVTDRHIDLQHTPLSQLNLRQMEGILKSNPYVSNAEVYADNERHLHIRVAQRVPVLRIFERDGGSYYLDTALQTMPLSPQFTPYLPVVTNVPTMPDDTNARNMKAELLFLERRLAASKFWNAQISSVTVNAPGDYELVPVIGKQRIIIGDTSGLDEKLSNLFAFYKKIQNRIGWDKYTAIDLRYRGQVVASPALKWKAPVDRAAISMNWVNAILESGKKDTTDIPDNPQIVNGGTAIVAQTAAPADKPQAPPAAAPASSPKPATNRVSAQPAPKPSAKPTPAAATAKPAAKPVAAKPAAVSAAKPAAATAKPSAVKPSGAQPAVKPAQKPAASATPKPRPAAGNAAAVTPAPASKPKPQAPAQAKPQPQPKPQPTH